MGYACVSTTLSPPASEALATLAEVKVQLSIDATDTSNDAWLTQAIGQVSAAIIRYCKRGFAPRQIQDVFDIEQDSYPWQTPGGFPQLELSHWPVLEVTSVFQLLAAGANPQTQTLVAGTDYRLDARTGRLLRLSPFSGAATLWEADPVTVVYVAGFGALVTETNIIPGAGPFVVTVQQAAAFSCDVGVAYAGGAALTRVAGVPGVGQYGVNAATAAYTFNAADAGQDLTFSYATASIPADLVDSCLQIVSGRYASKGRDPTLIMRDTPNVGTERWWFGGAPGQKGAFPPDIAAALDDYRVPTVA